MAGNKKTKLERKIIKFDKSKLQGFQDTVIVKVPTPEWPNLGDIYVRSMTGRSRDSYEGAIYLASEKAKETGNGTRLDNLRANLVVATACDKDGNLLFDASDAEWLGNKSAAVLDRIADASKDLAGISAEDVAEMEKKSEAGQS